MGCIVSNANYEYGFFTLDNIAFVPEKYQLNPKHIGDGSVKRALDGTGHFAARGVKCSPTITLDASYDLYKALEDKYNAQSVCVFKDDEGRQMVVWFADFGLKRMSGSELWYSGTISLVEV